MTRRCLPNKGELMTDTAMPQTPLDEAEEPKKDLDKKVAEEKEEEPFWPFLLKLALFVLIFRSFIFSPFSIPSESMLPRLWNGDYLFAAKWPYGVTNHSLPMSAPLIPGRIFASEPERGDIVIFKHPIDESDYIKRVIGLPGDQIAMRDGQVVLNGAPIPKEKIDDFIIPVSDNTDCHSDATEQDGADGVICKYSQYRETLPNGVTYNVIDLGERMADNFGPVLVPEGKMFLMGDNRDNSQDSRFAAQIGGGVGMVDQDLLVGRASMMMWSTDGSASWLLPWTWFTAARWDRMGGTF